MVEHVIIDGNNLLHAMHEHAPLPSVGRETLVKVIERWARRAEVEVTLVFDGAPPRAGLTKQMTSACVAVRFSAPATADDVIVDIIQHARNPSRLRVISGDTAIRHEARRRRCRHSSAVEFVQELFPRPDGSRSSTAPSSEKPPTVSPENAKEWHELFGSDDDEPFDGFDAMKP